MLEAPKASKFCNILAGAYTHALPGFWKGSVYRSHPCGVVRRGIIFTNEWNTNDYCSASVILDPAAKLIKGDNCPASSGNPYIRPERGGTLEVYGTGRWSRDDGPWRQIILEVLIDLEKEIAVAQANNLAIRERQLLDAEQKRQAIVAAACIALRGEAA